MDEPTTHLEDPYGPARGCCFAFLLTLALAGLVVVIIMAARWTP